MRKVQAYVGPNGELDQDRNRSIARYIAHEANIRFDDALAVVSHFSIIKDLIENGPNYYEGPIEVNMEFTLPDNALVRVTEVSDMIHLEELSTHQTYYAEEEEFRMKAKKA